VLFWAELAEERTAKGRRLISNLAWRKQKYGKLWKARNFMCTAMYGPWHRQALFCSAALALPSWAKSWEQRLSNGRVKASNGQGGCTRQRHWLDAASRRKRAGMRTVSALKTCA
jgi:hypothetical protein